MIEVEGYKMFKGVMRIAPKSGLVAPFEKEGSWLYNPVYDCWYGCGSSYAKAICEIVEDKGDKE